MTQDENQVNKENQQQKLETNKISTDVKLLICQLVLDAKNDNITWNDILIKLINHPIITYLHKDEGINILDTFTEDQLIKLFINIINETVLKSDIITDDNNKDKRPKLRGRRPKDNKANSNTNTNINTNEQLFDINSNIIYNIEYFQTVENRQYVSICCSKLHKVAINEIKDKLNENRDQFGKILTSLT